MNLRELKWPVRIYWDLPAGRQYLSGGSADSDLRMKVCKELVETKVMFLSLQDSSTAGRCCVDVIDRLRGGNIGLSLTVSDHSTAYSLSGRLNGFPVKTLFVEASSLHEVRSLSALPFGISFEIRRDNCHELPEIVSFCLNNGIDDLLFPIQRLEKAKARFRPGRKEREEISRGLKGVDHRGLRLTIHDPFLWELFFPNADYHEGGCQAANSMLYISSEYKVYPCPAMPVELGDLHDMSLSEVILSEKKKKLRSSLLDPPRECAPCERAAKCLGGCRGRAYAISGSLDIRDPACSL